jgi:hypothetical protein
VSNRAALALALAVSLATGATARAEPPAAGARRVDVPKLEAQRKAARVKRNLGWGLAAAGVALTCAGAALIGVATTDGNLSFDDAVLEAVAGGATALVGLLLAIPGAVLALRNQDAITDVEWRLRAAGATAFIAPARSGATVGARFTF